MAVMFLLTVIPFVLLRGSRAPQAEASWWNSSWQYRQRVDVANSNATDLTDFQVSFTIDTASLITAGKLQSECQDIRVTDIGGRELPHWIEENNPGCNSATTKVWVKMPNLSRSGGTLYAYYGNSSVDVSPNHDGNKVFEFFEDFSGDSLPNNYVANGTHSIESGELTIDTGSVYSIEPIKKDSQNYIFEYRHHRNGSGYFSGMSISDEDHIHGSNGGSNSVVLHVSLNSSLNIVSYAANGTQATYNINSNSSQYSALSDTNYVDGFAITPTQIKYFHNRTEVNSFSGTFNVDPHLILGVFTGAELSSNGSALVVDWVISRKFASADPTISLAAEETTPGPIAYWKFDEGSGVTVNDSAGSNTSTITGATWASEDQCVSGKCLSFNGTSDYVATPRQISSLNKGFTIQAWAYLTASSGWRWIVGEASDSYFFIGKSNQGNFMHIGFNGVFGASNISEAVFHPNQWYHVTVAWDGTANSNSIKIYLNGGLVAQRRATGTSLSNGNLNIGRRSISEFWQGQIDEVKIFPYALTEDQIKAEYNLGAAAVIGTGPTVAPPAGGTLKNSLVAHWAFDEQYGQTAHNKVGDNHGTFGASTSPGSDDPTWKPSGECKVNGCLSFDGTGDYVQLSTSEPFKITSKSVTFWGNLTSIPNTFRLAVGGNSSNWYTGFASNGRMISSHVNSTWSQRVTYSSTNILTDNTWDHYAYTWDVNGSIVTVRLYKNGKLVGSDDFADGYSSAYGSLFILGALSPSSAFFQGKLDELKLYNTALTPEQVLQDMNAGASLTVGIDANEADEIIDGAGAPPIAEWKFDEHQGTTAYDTSGNGNDGAVNGATWKQGCQQGACLEFDGDNDQIALGSGAWSTITGPVTVNAWVKTTSNSAAGIISKYGTNSYFTYRLYINTDGTVTFNRGDYNVFNTNITSISSINDGQWHFISGIFDGSLMKIIIDGHEEASIAETRSSEDHEQHSACIGVDRYNCLTSGFDSKGYFNGQIDHVKIYDYARTPAQIAYDYNRGAPVAHWRFDECEGTVAHDSSGNEHHGTINIGATGTQSTAGTCSTSGAWANGASGKFSGSLNFDGIDDYVELDSARLSFERTSPFSIGLWMKPAALTTNTIFSKQLASSPYTGYALWLLSNGSVKFEMFNSTGSTMHSSAGTLVTGKWQHILITYDGSGSSADVNIYINGNPESTSDSGSISGSITNSVAPQIMGREGPNRVSSGQIDDVRVYNYVLSPAQVRKIMNEGASVRYGE